MRKAKPEFYFNNIKFNSSYYDTEINDNIPRPINQSTSVLNSVLTLTNLSPIQTSWTVPATVITNYVNYASPNLISNVSGTPTTITDLVLSSSLGSSTAQKFVLPSNTSTSTVGQVLSILNATTKTTQWVTIPTQISNYVNYASPNLISNVSGTPTTITDLVLSSSLGSSTAQKFVLPSNTSTSTVGQVLSILDATTKTTQWITIPTQITNYTNYDNTLKTLISNVSGTPTTITDLVISSSIGSITAQKFVLPSNTSTSTVGQVLSILDATAKTTQWITIPTQITNYTNYDNTLKTLISNVSGTPTTITDLVISSSIGSITAQKFVLPSNTSTSTVGQVLSILDATAKTTQWITIPTQISNYVNYNNTTKILNSNVSGSIVDLVLSETIGISTDHKFKLPSNTATASAYDVLALTNMTTKSTNWTTVPIITNYTNYDNTLKTLISNVSGTPTTIVDLVISSSIGSATAQKFVLPSNSSSSTVGQVLSILDATAKTTQWITIPTQISTYVDYNIFTGVLIYKSLSPATNINTIIIDDIGKSGQTFTLPTNTSSSTVGQVLSILNATSKTTQWITIPTQISNYVNYSTPNLISNVSGAPTTISDLTISGNIISGNIKSNSYDSSVADTGIITIGGGTLRTGDINIGTSKNTSSAQLIRIGSNDSNATGQEIRFSRPIQPPAIIQLSDRDMGYTSTNLTATSATYASGTVSLSIPTTYFYSNGNYMFKCSLTISSTTSKVLTNIKFGLNKTTVAPLGFVSNCFTDISINTGTASIFTNKTYQLSSFFRYLGAYSFDYIITFTGTGTLNVVSSIDFIRIS